MLPKRIESMDNPNVEDAEIWERRKPVMADHIRVKRMDGVYAHHGVYISDEEVIHFTGTEDDSIFDWSKNEVIKSDLKFFLKGGELEVKEYTDAEYKDLYPPEHIVRYARSCIGDMGYNLVFNNCEHFANFCTLGRFRSLQVEGLLKNILGVILESPREEEPSMGIFGKVFNFLFGDSSKNTSERTVYEPDKVQVAEIEAKTKIRLATMERERAELMHKALLDYVQAQRESQEALIAAKVKGFAATAEVIVRMQDKLSEIAEKRMNVIESASLANINAIETAYREIEGQIESDNDEYTRKKLPEMLAILEQYDESSPAHKLYFKRIDNDISIQMEHYRTQLSNLALRQQKVIDSNLQAKEQILRQTGEVTQSLLGMVQQELLKLGAGNVQEIKEMQQLLPANERIALNEGTKEAVK